MEGNRHSLGLKIKRTADLLKAAANHDMDELGLTFSQLHVLIYLSHKAEEKVAMKELEKTFQVSQATMAGIVVRMEQKGFVTSCTDPADHRVKLVDITQAGIAVCADARKRMVRREDRLLSGFSKEEIQTMNSMLDAIQASLTETAKEAS